jgi:hypothetical protein
MSTIIARELIYLGIESMVKVSLQPRMYHYTQCFFSLKVRPNVSDMSMGFLPHLELTYQSFARVMPTQFEQI